jgi:hypothetical protein
MYRRSKTYARKTARVHARGQAALAGGKWRAPFTHQQLGEFERQIHGHVVVPGDPDYETARQVFYRQFQCLPEIIVYCVCANDVNACLRFARVFGLSVVCRSGGHSSAGFSINDSMVIDLSHLNSVSVDPVQKRAIVGSGTSFHRLNAVLSDHGLHVPGGGCDEVCIGGYMQGGGYGFTSREFGMNCDNVISFEMMLWNGGIVTASATVNPDLYWCVCGGMGTNYGVLLSVTYQLYDLGTLYGFGLSWDAENAPAALAAMQAGFIKGDVHKKLGYQCAVMIDQGAPRFYIRGLYNGDKAACKAAIKPLCDLPGTSLDIEMTGDYVELNRELLEKPVPIPSAPDYVFEEKQSAYVDKVMTVADWKKIIDFIATSPNTWNDLGIEPYGGAIERTDDPNSFIHRSVSMNLFMEVFWFHENEYQPNIDWLNQFMDLIEPYTNGQSYQNYPRPGVKDAPEAYWADYLGTLASAKTKYNPDNWFANPQNIGMLTIDPPGAPSPKGPKFPVAPIVYTKPPTTPE